MIVSNVRETRGTPPDWSRTIRAQQTELLAYFSSERASNGPDEAVNLGIKRVKCVGFGFLNFANYRPRLLLHCGITWRTDRTPQIRDAHHAWWRRATYPPQLDPSSVRPERRCLLVSPAWMSSASSGPV